MREVQQNKTNESPGAKSKVSENKDLNHSESFQFENQGIIQQQKFQDAANNSKVVSQLMKIQGYSDQSANVRNLRSLGDVAQTKGRNLNPILKSPSSNVTQLVGETNDASSVPDAGSPLEKGRNYLQENYIDKSDLIEGDDGKGAYSKNTLKGEALKGVGGATEVASDAQGTVEDVEVVMEPSKVMSDVETAKSEVGKLGSIDLDNLGENISQVNLVETYFSVIESLDVFKITKAFSAVGNIFFAKREKKKIAVLEKQKTIAASAPDFPDDLMSVAVYALKKVTRSYYTAIARGILQGIQFISRIATIISGGAAGVVTEIIGLISTIVEKAEKYYRMLNGVWKFLKGRKGIARKKNAEKVFDLVATGNTHAIAFIKDYYAAGFGFMQKKMLEYIQSKADAHMTGELNSQLDNGMEQFFNYLKVNQTNPEIKVLKDMVVKDLALQFRSFPPSGGSTLFQLVLQQEGVKAGLSEAWAEATN